MLTQTCKRQSTPEVAPIGQVNKHGVNDLRSHTIKGRSVSRRQKPIVVELGNIGLDWKGEQSSSLLIRSAQRHPKWMHIGIDIAESTLAVRKNIIQIQSDFLSGLEIFDNNSASMIISRFSVGYYTRRGKQLPVVPAIELLEYAENPYYQKIRGDVSAYTNDIIDLCAKKLRPNGVMYFQVCTTSLGIITKAAEQSSLIADAKVLPLNGSNDSAIRSFWAREISKEYMLFNVKLRKHK